MGAPVPAGRLVIRRLELAEVVVERVVAALAARV